MFKLALYLSKTFTFIWLMSVFGFLVLIGLLDSLANGADIVASGQGFKGTFKYMYLRAPVIFDRIFIFTLVVSTLLTYVKLIRQHELVALLGFGISVPKQIMLLMPAVVGAAILSVTFIDFAMAPAVRALQAWGIGEYKVKNITPDNPLWLEDNGQIIKASTRYDYGTLGDLEIFSRSRIGEVNDVIWADRAIYKDNKWELIGAKTVKIEGADGEEREIKNMIRPQMWVTKQTPKSIARLAAEPRDLSLSEMKNFSQKGNSGSKPRFAYGFWYAHRMTRPIAAFILLMCCAGIMQRTGREDTGDKALILGITLGFIFLIIDGAMATFAASGGLSVMPAIIMPLFVFGLLGSFLVIRTESL